MTPSRRQLLRIAAGTVALPALSLTARGEAYPARPVHLIVGFAAGSGPDIVGRLIGGWLAEHLGQPFVVENRPGAASALAAEAVVRAAADGYTLLHVTVANAINPDLNSGSSFARGIAPIGGIAKASFFVVVDSASSHRTVPQLIANARKNPGQLAMASSSTGTAPYLAGELFKMMSGTDILHVPYSGTPQAVADLLAGRVQLAFADPSAIPLIKAGKLRALAVTAETRQDIFPDVPPLGDFVAGYEASTWHGMGAPANVTPQIVDRLNQGVNAAIADSTIKARLANVGFTVTGGSPADFGNLIAKEIAKWRSVTKVTGLKAD
jgi:tripartite-type tricarboxylate transporter receptor subunit TctC